MNQQTSRNEKKDLVGKFQFILVTFGVFGLITIGLVIEDLIPVRPTANDGQDIPQLEASSTAQEPSSADTSSEEVENIPSSVPTRIAIEGIGVDTIVLSPASTDVQVLDRALLSGAVQYPGSGNAGEYANMLIFGHSSYLPVVHNQAFKAFNEIGKLSTGDIVTVYSETHVYEYTVRDVYLAKADDAVIYFEAEEPTLTLATCNSFGAKQERWVVTATLSKQYAL